MKLIYTKNETRNHSLFEVIPQGDCDGWMNSCLPDELEASDDHTAPFNSKILLKTFPFHVIFDKNFKIKQVRMYIVVVVKWVLYSNYKIQSN